MESDNWERFKENGWLLYSVSKTFDKCVYKIDMVVDDTFKNTKFWVSVSSGNKRKDLEIFMEKDKKSTGGIKALLWCKTMILSFPDFYRLKNNYNKPCYIHIHWSDNKRRNIYERLLKEGFKYMIIDNKKILIKEFK